MNSENKNEFETNDIIKNTEIKYVKNECENTGKIWKRNCPKCNKIIYFSSKGNYKSSIKNNCFCRNCSNILKRWNNKLPEIKYCKICNSIINHKRIFCSIKCFNFYQKNLNLKICNWCNKKFNRKEGFRNFCSVECKEKYKNNKYTKICYFCKNKFVTYDQKYCSVKCRNNGLKKEIPVKYCKLCGNKFQNKQKKVKFCSHHCSVVYYLKFGNRISIPEIKLRKILFDKNINFISSFPLKNKIYDFYIPDKNLLIEVDGIYWHSKDKVNLNHTQIKNIENDNIKNRLAKEMGYNLLRVWENDIKNVPEYICEPERWNNSCMG